MSTINLGIVKRSTMPRKSSAKSAPGERDKEADESMPDALGFHGIPETNKDTDEAVLATCNNKLGLQLTQDCIDRSHCLGVIVQSSPIIVKFTCYESRRKTFTSKRKLKGTKLIITEHLTKRRAELLHSTL